MTVTVAICAWNAERFLTAALDSIAAQTAPPAEILLVDDGSTDATAAIAAGHPVGVRVLRMEHRGLAAGRNTVIDSFTGDYLTFLDADDLLPAASLAARVAWLDAHPGDDGVFGACIQFRDSDGAEEPPAPAQLAATLLVRRRVFDPGERFDESFRVGEFIDWCSRVQERGATFASIDDVVLRRRNHDSNMGLAAAADGSNVDYLRLVREHLRRKAAGR